MKTPCSEHTMKTSTDKSVSNDSKSPGKRTFYIYTDGSCLQGNKIAASDVGYGGWAVAIISPIPNKNVCFGGGEAKTTSSRMEVTAVYRALQRIAGDGYTGVTINLWSDSEYVVGGINNLSRWKSRKWQTQGNTPLKNLDLWQAIDKLITDNSFTVFPHWIKGHNGHVINEMVDAIAKYHCRLTAASFKDNAAVYSNILKTDIDNARQKKDTERKAGIMRSKKKRRKKRRNTGYICYISE